jgi:hypothetical protein
MNLELQGKDKHIAEMMSTVSFYRNKSEQMVTDFTNNTYHFPNMQDHLEEYPNFAFLTEKYVNEICSVIQDFGNAFCDFQKIRRVLEYLSFSFKTDLNTKETSATNCENYSLSKPSLEKERLTFFSRLVLDKNHFGS